MRLWDIRTGCAVAALATGYPLVAVGHLDPLVTKVRPLHTADETLALVDDGHAPGRSG